MEELDNPIKRLIVGGITTCYNRCAASKKNNDYLNKYQQNCVGKCMDKYYQNHAAFMGMINQALPDSKAAKQAELTNF